MQSYQFAFRVLFIVLSALVFATALRAQTAAPSPHPLFFKDDNQLPRVSEPSAVALIGDGKLLLVADDDITGLFVVEANTGAVKQKLTFGGAYRDLDWEAMARDPEGNYYIAGSKGTIVRFALGFSPDGTPVKIAEHQIVFEVGKELKKTLSEKDFAIFEIEGLAFRADDQAKTRKLLIGLRKPPDKVRVFEADITQSPATLKLLFSFDVKEFCGLPSTELSSLEYVPELKGFLMLTANETNLPSGQVLGENTLWFVGDEQILAASGGSVTPEKIRVFRDGLKAEGLCVLSITPNSSKGGVPSSRLAITYDNDGKPDGSLEIVDIPIKPSAPCKTKEKPKTSE